VCNAARFPHDLSLIFHCSLLSLSRLLNKRPDVWLYFGTHALEEGERFKWTLLRKNIAFPLSAHHLSRMHMLQAALCGRKDSANLAFQQMRCTNSIQHEVIVKKKYKFSFLIEEGIRLFPFRRIAAQYYDTGTCATVVGLLRKQLLRLLLRNKDTIKVGIVEVDIGSRRMACLGISGVEYSGSAPRNHKCVAVFVYKDK